MKNIIFVCSLLFALSSVAADLSGGADFVFTEIVAFSKYPDVMSLYFSSYYDADKKELRFDLYKVKSNVSRREVVIGDGKKSILSAVYDVSAVDGSINLARFETRLHDVAAVPVSEEKAATAALLRTLETSNVANSIIFYEKNRKYGAGDRLSLRGVELKRALKLFDLDGCDFSGINRSNFFDFKVVGVDEKLIRFELNSDVEKLGCMIRASGGGVINVEDGRVFDFNFVKQGFVNGDLYFEEQFLLKKQSQ